MKVYQPQLATEVILDLGDLDIDDLQLPLEVNLDWRSFEIPAPTIMQRLWARFKCAGYLFTMTNKRQQQQYHLNDLIQQQVQQEQQQEQQHGNKITFMKKKETVLDSLPDSELIDLVVNDNTEVTPIISSNKAPLLTTKRPHTSMDGDDDNKKPLLDSTNNYDQDTQPSKKRVCRTIHAGCNFSYRSATDSVTNHQQKPLYNYYIESPILDNLRNSKYSVSSKSGSDGDSTNSSGIKKNNNNKKRNHQQIYNGIDDLVQQKSIDFENDSLHRDMKRQRTTLHSLTITNTTNEHDQTARKNLLVSDTQTLGFIVVCLFIIILYFSYFNSHCHPIPHSN